MSYQKVLSLLAVGVCAACGAEVIIDDGGGAAGTTMDSVGGNVPGPSTSGEPSDYGAMCAARAANCHADEAYCLAHQACVLSFLRDDVESQIIDCLTAACVEQPCVEEILVSLSPIGEAFQQDCLARAETECDGTTFSGARCDLGWFVVDEFIHDHAECLSLPCDEINDCMNDVSACKGT